MAVCRCLQIGNWAPVFFINISIVVLWTLFQFGFGLFFAIKELVTNVTGKHCLISQHEGLHEVYCNVIAQSWQVVSHVGFICLPVTWKSTAVPQRQRHSWSIYELPLQ